ncbi:MAG TPA: MBL fold metallo-hydrolase [Caulobacteraceae bacterium]|jgi:metallo-beta-lactamase class B
MRTSTTALAALLGLTLASAAAAQGFAAFPVSGPPDWAGAKAHADKAKALAGEQWKAAAEYFCSPGVRVNLITDPEIEPTRLFDNVWALGDEGTTVYAVTTPDGIVLIDALYPDKYEKTLLPQMAKAGLDPAKVKYVLITHGHADHFGGSAYFQQKYGAKVVLSAVDWDGVAKARMPAGHPAPKRDVEAQDGEAITVGGMAFTPVFVPGHTPGSLAWIFPVSEGGKTHMAGLFGSTILRNDRLTTDNLAQELGSWEKWAKVTKAKKVDVELQNHPLFDGMPEKLRAIRARAPGQPNPFVVGEAAYQRFTGTVAECLKADIAKKGGKVPG